MCRRDYGGLFDAVASNTELMSAPNFSLRLIGQGALEIPASLHGKSNQGDRPALPGLLSLPLTTKAFLSHSSGLEDRVGRVTTAVWP